MKLATQHFIYTEDAIALHSDNPLKVVSSALHNAGIGYYRYFVNRSVPYTYSNREPHREMSQYLQNRHYPVAQTVAMMTAVYAHLGVVRDYSSEYCDITVMVTAGLGNAVDVTRAIGRQENYHVGTINLWVIINGKLTDEALLQALITATEAKSKALFDEHILDPTTQTIATGTSTDSVLIASSQQGENYAYAGPITELGKIIGYGVYQTMRQAIQNYKKDKEENHD